MDVLLEDIAGEDLKVIIKRDELTLENVGKIVVDLDGKDATGVLAEGACHGSETGTDLKDEVLLRDVRRSEDLVEDARVGEEVLTEALAGVNGIALDKVVSG